MGRAVQSQAGGGCEGLAEGRALAGRGWRETLTGNRRPPTARSYGEGLRANRARGGVGAGLGLEGGREGEAPGRSRSGGVLGGGEAQV